MNKNKQVNPKQIKKKKRLRQKKLALKKLNKQKKRNRIIRKVIFSLCLIALLVYLQSFFFFSIVKVNSYGMSPALKFGEYVLIERKQTFQRQDIVLIKRGISKKTEIKRIIGLPNEKLAYTNDQLLINDEERDEPFIAAEKNAASVNSFNYTKDFSLFELTGETTIAKDYFFVLGDNRLYSTDSREYGLIQRKEILGVISTPF